MPTTSCRKVSAASSSGLSRATTGGSVSAGSVTASRRLAVLTLPEVSVAEARAWCGPESGLLKTAWPEASRARGTPSTVRLVAAIPTPSLAATVSRLLPPGAKRRRLAVRLSAGGVVSAATWSARAWLSERPPGVGHAQRGRLGALLAGLGRPGELARVRVDVHAGRRHIQRPGEERIRVEVRGRRGVGVGLADLARVGRK